MHSQLFSVHSEAFLVHRQTFFVQSQPFPVHSETFLVHRQPFPVNRQPFPVYRQRFPVHRQPFPLYRQRFPAHRQPFPVHLGTFFMHSKFLAMHNETVQRAGVRRAGQTDREGSSLHPGAKSEVSAANGIATRSGMATIHVGRPGDLWSNERLKFRVGRRG